jgi:hypothetical protein
MIGYVGVDEQVDRDFYSALRRASLHRLRDRVFGRSAQAHVLSFEEARSALMRWTQVYRGMRTIEVEKIVGSVGRWRDFDGDFLPRKGNMKGRWSRVDRAYHQGVELPFVSLYKIGEIYFVVDGNHRVSVARYHKVVTIDAEVIELRGHKRKAAAHGAAQEPRSPLGSPQRPSWAVASWLLDLWRYLRPGPRRPGPQPLA